jgi:hypothetical protein
MIELFKCQWLSEKISNAIVSGEIDQHFQFFFIEKVKKLIGR